jgi:hypothetical protein
LTKVFISRILINFYNINHISVPARISKAQGAGPEKGLFSAMNNILHVKLNCNKQCYEHVSDTVVAKFF